MGAKAVGCSALNLLYYAEIAGMPKPPTDVNALPYKLAVLCVLHDREGRMLLLERAKAPNKGLFSPIGGKVETSIGESPTACAQREIQEEAGIDVPLDRLKLVGMISEAGYEGQGHWLMFMYEVVGPVQVEWDAIDEGGLSWHHPEELGALPQPESDRQVIWPLYRKHRGEFFAAHIEGHGPGMRWRQEQPAEAAGPWQATDRK